MLDLSKKKNIKKKVKVIISALHLILNPLIFVELKSNPKEKNISQLLLFSLAMNFFKIEDFIFNNNFLLKRILEKLQKCGGWHWKNFVKEAKNSQEIEIVTCGVAKKHKNKLSIREMWKQRNLRKNLSPERLCAGIFDLNV